jgi:hypothetical protein
MQCLFHPDPDGKIRIRDVKPTYEKSNYKGVRKSLELNIKLFLMYELFRPVVSNRLHSTKDFWNKLITTTTQFQDKHILNATNTATYAKTLLYYREYCNLRRKLEQKRSDKKVTSTRNITIFNN